MPDPAPGSETGFLADCRAVVERLKGLLPMPPGEDGAAQARLLFQPWRDFAARYRVLRSCLPQEAMADDSGWRQVDRQVSLVTALLTPPMPADAETGQTQLRLAGLLIGQIIEREEAAETSLVAKARSAGLDSDDLERWLAAFAEDRDPPAWSPAQKRPSTSTEETMMPRTPHTPDRDDRGRFVGDDDRGYRGDSTRERDDRGRFASDDDDRRYARGRDDDHGYRGGSTYRERDDQGRFTSDDDRRYARGRDDDRGYRGGSTYRERDDQGRFASDDDRRYFRGRDDDDRGYRGDSTYRERDERGRFASDDDDRRYVRGRDDDDRGYRGDSTYRERDERGRFASDDDDRRGQGQGWFGDARGHSEASRPGWERRRDDDDDDRGRGSRSRRT